MGSKTTPYPDIVLILLHVLVVLDYWAHALYVENSIYIKTANGYEGGCNFSLSHVNGFSKTETTIFLFFI